MKDAGTIVPRFAALLVALGMTAGITSASEQGQPLQLRTIMQQLGRDMQEVVDAISREDWGRVAELAPGIASHEQPSAAEKAKILAWVGKDAPRFRGHDRAAHDAAVAMGEAAARGDGTAVIASFAQVQRSCLACHEQFRRGFVERFYGVQR